MKLRNGALIFWTEKEALQDIDTVYEKIALPCNFTPRELAKRDSHVLALEPHSYSISIAYSHFLQNHVCNLKHVSGYVFPIYQLFN